MKLVGVLLVLVGVVVGLYAGVWWAFIGGIIDIVNALKATDISAVALALGVAKVFFSGVIGWMAALVLIIPGMAIAQA